MLRSPIHSPPTLARSPSLDSLCMPDNEDFSLTAGQEVSLAPSPADAVDAHHAGSAGESRVLPSASDSTTTLGSREPAIPVYQSKSPIWKTAFLRDRWIWEITCILFSISCLTAITILSSRLDGTWLSKWAFFLQPSTTFSILITATQSSMMVSITEVLSQLKWLQMTLPKTQPVADFVTFDSASRGPLGSLRLLYTWKPHSIMLPPLAYAASLITIAALAMGPFTQEVISIEPDNLVVMDGINSTIAVTNYYYGFYKPGDPGLNMEIGGNGDIAVSTSMLGPGLVVDADVQGAFYNGYYNLGKSFIDFNCPSSNCSWETFNSLGVCSTCQNVTDNSQFIGDSLSVSRITTPGGWSIRLGGGPYVQVVAAANGTLLGLPLDTLSAHLVSMVVVQRPTYLYGFYGDKTYFVTECSIDWCAKQYSNVTIVRPS